MAKRELTPDEWDDLRPELERWHRSQHTASWIADELDRRHLKVTEKMLYYRFRQWKFPRKYKTPAKRQKVPPTAVSVKSTRRLEACHGRPLGSPTPPSRALGTPSETFQLRNVLWSVSTFLDSIIESQSWRRVTCNDGLELQRLVAHASMAITSQRYDSRATWDELRVLGARASRVIMSFRDSSMHPRVLTALLRLLVEAHSSSEAESNALKVVRSMFWALSSRLLPSTHPVPALCGLSLQKGETPSFLNSFFNLLKARFHDKVVSMAPDFVACEQIYSARVLASVERTREADSQLIEVGRLDTISPHTRADYHRTIGFSRLHAGAFEEARLHTTQAVTIFDAIGEGRTDNAMFCHVTLSRVAQEQADVDKWVHHSESAVKCWESNKVVHENQGGITLVRGLHEAYAASNMLSQMDELRKKYAEYFEQSCDGSVS